MWRENKGGGRNWERKGRRKERTGWMAEGRSISKKANAKEGKGIVKNEIGKKYTREEKRKRRENNKNNNHTKSCKARGRKYRRLKDSW